MIRVNVDFVVVVCTLACFSRCDAEESMDCNTVAACRQSAMTSTAAAWCVSVRRLLEEYIARSLACRAQYSSTGAFVKNIKHQVLNFIVCDEKSIAQDNLLIRCDW